MVLANTFKSQLSFGFQSTLKFFTTSAKLTQIIARSDVNLHHISILLGFYIPFLPSERVPLLFPTLRMRTTAPAYFLSTSISYCVSKLFESIVLFHLFFLLEPNSLYIFSQTSFRDVGLLLIILFFVSV